MAKESGGRPDVGHPIAGRLDDAGMHGDGDAVEPGVAAIEGLRASLQENMKDERVLAQRLEVMADSRRSGRSWREVISSERAPGALSLLGRISGRLTDAGGAFRRALALGLEAEGEGPSDIAKRFGVSRQRVFTLLRSRGGSRPQPSAD
jgi:hypothetical protein